jgi:PAS domain S-box-containing protein
MNFNNPDRILFAIEEIETIINIQSNADEILDQILKKLLHLFSCDRAWLFYPCNPNQSTFEVSYERTKPSFPGAKAPDAPVPMTREMAEYCNRALSNSGSPEIDPPPDQKICNDMSLKFGLKPQIFMALKPQNDDAWMFGMHHCAINHHWTDDEKYLFKIIGQRITKVIENIIFVRQIKTREQEYRQLVAKEITKHQKTEKGLKESEERFRNLMENVDAVAVQGYGLDGTTQYWNKASERLYGYTQQEAIGSSLLDLIIPSEMRHIVAEEMRKMAQSGQPIPSGELLLLHKDGSRVPVISHHVIVTVPGREMELFCLDIDISELKRAEAERKKLQEQLNQAQKMEAVGRLAGGVAHDFNNMLGVILGYTELIFEKIDSTQDLYSDLKEIQKAAKRSADLTKQLLTFARKQIIDPQVIDLNKTVESMLKILRRLIGEDIDLSWLPTGQLWPIKIDPTQIDQILANLCVNARDAIAGVGKLTIETQMKTFDAAYCADHPGFIPGDYVILAVADNGCGMNKETLNNLFEPFFTTKDVGEGTGLGLATIYGIVKQNNGFINVYSEPGQGTSFKIYLPRFHTSEKPQKESLPEKSTLTGNETILLVEDEPAILRMTRMMLQRKGYLVLSAATPADAISIADAYVGKIDILITDVVMPEMNGRDLSEKITAIFPEIKLLFMSGYAAKAISQQGVLDNTVAFIQKPFSMNTLAEKIRMVIDEPPSIKST